MFHNKTQKQSRHRAEIAKRFSESRTVHMREEAVAQMSHSLICKQTNVLVLNWLTEIKANWGRSPVELEVWGEDEFPRMIHRSPHQAQHQDLQPAALEQVDLISQTQLHKAWGDGQRTVRQTDCLGYKLIPDQMLSKKRAEEVKLGFESCKNKWINCFSSFSDQ